MEKTTVRVETLITFSWHPFSDEVSDRGNYHIGRGMSEAILSLLKKHFSFAPCWQCGEWVVILDAGGDLASTCEGSYEGLQGFSNEIMAILREEGNFRAIQLEK